MPGALAAPVVVVGGEVALAAASALTVYLSLSSTPAQKEEAARKVTLALERLGNPDAWKASFIKTGSELALPFITVVARGMIAVSPPAPATPNPTPSDVAKALDEIAAASRRGGAGSGPGNNGGGGGNGGPLARSLAILAIGGIGVKTFIDTLSPVPTSEKATKDKGNRLALKYLCQLPLGSLLESYDALCDLDRRTLSQVPHPVGAIAASSAGGKSPRSSLDSAASEAVTALKRFWNCPDEEVPLTELGRGKHNRIFLAERTGQHLVVNVHARVRSPDLDGLESERITLNHLESKGMGPKVISHEITPSGRRLLILEFIPGRNMTPADFRQPHFRNQVARILKAIHSGPAVPKIETGDMRLLEMEKSLLAKEPQFATDWRGTSLKEYSDFIHSVFSRIQSVASQQKLSPIHNDAKPENFRVTPEGLVRVLDLDSVRMGWPLSDVTNMGTYAARKGELRKGIEQTAIEWGVPRSDFKKLWATAAFRLLRRAGYILNQDEVTREKFESAFDDAKEAIRIFKSYR